MISAHLCIFCKIQTKGRISHLSALPYLTKKTVTFKIKIFYNQIFVLVYVNGQSIARQNCVCIRPVHFLRYFKFLCRTFAMCILLLTLLYI